MYNKAFLIGNLARDPELRYTPSGIPVCWLVVAVNRTKPKAKQEADEKGEVDFIPVVAWRRLAEICGEYLKKGRPVAIEGRLQVRSYEKGGVQRTSAEVVADGMQMLGRRTDGPSSAPSSAPHAQPHEEEPHEEAAGGEEVPF
jgi:single-strand DNA-binding protein